MEVADAARIELGAELGGDGGGDQLARGGQIVQPLEQPVQPGRDARRRTSPRTCGSGRRWRPAGCPARSRRRCRPAATSSRKRRKQSGEKKNWVIARSAPASILRLRLSRSAAAARRIRMAFGIGGDRNLERRDLLQARDQLGGIGIAVGMRRERLARLGRIAAQRDDVADAGVPIGARDVVDLAAARLDAGQVRGGVERWSRAAIRATVAWVRSRVEPPAP